MRTSNLLISTLAWALLGAGALHAAQAGEFRCSTGGSAAVTADDEFQALCKAAGSCAAARREYAAGQRCAAIVPSAAPREFVCKASGDAWAAVPDPLYLRAPPPQLEQRAREWYGARFGSAAADCMPAAQYADLRASQRAAAPSAATTAPARVDPSKSPWLDAVNRNNATGPCVTAEQACFAACGNPREVGSKDGFRSLECRSACTQQRSVCALEAAKPYAGGTAR